MMNKRSILWNKAIQTMRRILLDSILIPVAFYVALFTLFGGDCTGEQVTRWSGYLLPIAGVHIAINALAGIYRRLWAYADLRDAWHVLRATLISTLLLLSANAAWSWFPDWPASVLVLGGLFFALLSSGAKYRRYLLPGSTVSGKRVGSGRNETVPERVLIVGTNSVARQFTARLSRNHQSALLNVVGYVDNDVTTDGMWINGIEVLGTMVQIPELVETLRIDVVIIALRDVSRAVLWDLIALCQKTSAQIKVLPDVDALMDQGYESPLTFRDLHVEDLLQRRPLQINQHLCQSLLRDKVILVTGAAGSIGSELCRQLCRFQPAQLLTLDNNETELFNLNLALNREYDIPVLLLLADVADKQRIAAVFREHRPHLVFHAAAYKHVPLMETNPDQSLRVNIQGTINVSEMAHRHHVQRFVFISTDKAVEPSSVMGASKYACELWLRALNAKSETMFTAVRFGNVVGSRGSVLPIFAKQIEQGGPVTVTHKEMKRYFMSIPEAVNLLLEAAAYGRGGDVFMLDMGEEVRIQDLAERMIRLKGLRVHKDIPIQYIGMRPGEKLREALSYHAEQQLPTPHPRVFRLKGEVALPSLAQFKTAVSRLERIPEQRDAVQFLRQGIFQLARQPFAAVDQLREEMAVSVDSLHPSDVPKIKPA
ncbi:MAG: polysaccharide biosynthesis protein [Anaerolineales bacterium]|nr:polysaccharide biosynthesis protein [Anaerolineales bacterium]